MNRSTKVLMAAGLIAAGYGVATLVGSPQAPYAPRPFQPPAVASMIPEASIVKTADGERLPPPIAGVRLLPKVAANQNVIRAQSEPLTPLPPPPYPSTNSEPVYTELFTNSEPASQPSAARQTMNFSQVAAGPVTASVAAPSVQLHARFIDSPPRVSRNDSSELATTTPKSAEIAAVPTNIAVRPWPKTATELPAALPQPPEISATYIAPVQSTVPGVRLTAIAPSTGTLPAPPRTHRVIDGDSLPKLAKRYLQDASRADEIFALNREVLTSPDLLPIGTELTIPTVRATAHGG